MPLHSMDTNPQGYSYAAINKDLLGFEDDSSNS
jgi:hypothetical protein